MTAQLSPSAIGRTLDRLVAHVAKQTAAGSPDTIYLPVPRNAIEATANVRLLDIMEREHPNSILVYTTTGEPGPTP